MEEKNKSEIQLSSESKNKKLSQLLFLIGICLIPILTITGCGLKQSYSCSACGSSKTYTPLVASGIDDTTEVEYTSCVGPAGCLGCGLNTSCWPTECLYVEFSDDDDVQYSGIVYYYEDCGCIGNGPVMSSGKYDLGTDCGFFNCNCQKYNEKVNSDKTQAYIGPSCGGISCNKKPDESKDFNNNMPRKFPRGCVSACYDE